MTTVTAPTPPARLAYAWPAALGAAAVLGSLAAACMLPFVGLAVVAAATMTRARATATVIAVWLVNQLLGFTLLGYPWTGDAAAWGLALGVGSLAAMTIARAVLGGRRDGGVVQHLVAFAAAFAGYELLLYAFALVAGGTETFAPAIVLQILVNDASWFAGLAALHLALTHAAPRLFGRAPTLRLA